MDHDEVLTEMLLVPRPERLQVFLDEFAWAMDNAREYWRVVADLWTDAEYPSLQYEAWHRVWTDEHAQPSRMHAMTAEAQEQLEGLPARVAVYRGFTGDEWRGFSRTLERRRAEWFARRFAFLSRTGSPYVALATIDKTRILALLNTTHRE